MLPTVVRHCSRMFSTKGISLKTVVDFLESFAPTTLSEKWDNTGLLMEPQNPKPIANILLTNDLTEDVVQEAVNRSTDLIISYHPPIFRPLKSVTTSSWKERVIGTCIENKIAVYSPHTSWDCIPGGVNDWMVNNIGIIKDSKPITAIPENPKCGSGRLCTLLTELRILSIVENVKKATGLNHLKVALGRGVTLEDKITTAAVCVGSGGSVLRDVKAELYITGEMSHHELLDANHDKTTVILCNHSDSERGFLKEFAKKLTENFRNESLNVAVSEMDKDPIITV